MANVLNIKKLIKRLAPYKMQLVTVYGKKDLSLSDISYTTEISFRNCTYAN